MLVLTRREDESITLITDQGKIEVIVTKINKSQVQIAIVAPDEVEIVRTELLGDGEDYSE